MKLKYSPFSAEFMQMLIRWKYLYQLHITSIAILVGLNTELIGCLLNNRNFLSSLTIHLYCSKEQFLLLDCKLFKAYNHALYTSTFPTCLTGGGDTQKIFNMLLLDEWICDLKFGREGGAAVCRKINNTCLKENLENTETNKKQMLSILQFLSLKYTSIYLFSLRYI